jgi:hypothetical protein
MPTPRVVVADDHDETRARIDVSPRKRIAQSELLILDAQEVMSIFMVRGLPHAGRFHDTMRPIMDRVVGLRHPPVRVYGEMVETICHQHSHVVGEGRR